MILLVSCRKVTVFSLNCIPLLLKTRHAMNENDIKEALAGVVHPDTGEKVDVRSLAVSDDSVTLTISLPRSRDPFAATLKKQTVKAITDRWPAAAVTLFFEEPSTKKRASGKQPNLPGQIAGAACVMAVASGKGGVGKSTVTANLALALTGMGYRVGILDADIYGPSQGLLFGVGDYRPPVENRDGVDMILPAAARGIKIMSIGFFIDPSDALVWRGPMATGALRQMIHQTLWGELDYLLIDMPPGTGDVHLTILQEMKVHGAIVVTTPQALAVADVVRGIAMFRSEKIDVRVLGLVENMAWFEPAEHEGSRYHIFGQGGGEKLAREHGLPLLARIPLVLPRGEQFCTAAAAIVDNTIARSEYVTLAQKVITSLKC
jgi:ATP-binding protein involved in chromosome partitioning